jgi:hypothetical protein
MKRGRDIGNPDRTAAGIECAVGQFTVRERRRRLIVFRGVLDFPLPTGRAFREPGNAQVFRAAAKRVHVKHERAVRRGVQRKVQHTTSRDFAGGRATPQLRASAHWLGR